MTPPLIGIAGWKNSGKTTLAVRLIAELTRRGYRVSSIKHAHHAFQIAARRDRLALPNRLVLDEQALRRRAVAAQSSCRLWAPSMRH